MNPKKIGIFGCSGMARETMDIAQALGYDVFCIAKDAEERARSQLACPIELEIDLAKFTDVNFVIGIGEPTIRKKIAERYQTHLRFVSLIHPSATFGYGQRELVTQQTGVIVAAGVRFTSNTHVGAFTLFNLNATINHDCEIGAFATVSPQACILGNVIIGEGAWIGAGAVILQGQPHNKMRVGSYAMIGAGAVVCSPCDSYSTYMGVPAKKKT